MKNKRIRIIFISLIIVLLLTTLTMFILHNKSKKEDKVSTEYINIFHENREVFLSAVDDIQKLNARYISVYKSYKKENDMYFKYGKRANKVVYFQKSDKKYEVYKTLLFDLSFDKIVQMNDKIYFEKNGYPKVNGIVYFIGDSKPEEHYIPIEGQWFYYSEDLMK